MNTYMQAVEPYDKNVRRAFKQKPQAVNLTPGGREGKTGDAVSHVFVCSITVPRITALHMSSCFLP